MSDAELVALRHYIRREAHAQTDINWE